MAHGGGGGGGFVLGKQRVNHINLLCNFIINAVLRCGKVDDDIVSAGCHLKKPSTYSVTIFQFWDNVQYRSYNVSNASGYLVRI